MSGLAKVKAEVIDISVLVNTGIKGIHAFLGETERGKIGTSVLVSTWTEFVNNFGGLLTTTDFPLLCKRALDAGCRLRVARAANYGDPTDASTLVGAEAAIIVDTDGRIVAKSKGTWGNQINIETVVAASGRADKYDINVWIGANKTEFETISDVNTTITVADIAKINNKSRLVDFTTEWLGKNLAAVFTAGDVALSLVNGVSVGTPLPVDYIGDSAAATGIHSLDNHADFVRISIPTQAIGSIDTALAAYAERRKDCRAILRTPLGISGATAIAYRDKTAPYDSDGVAVNSWYASMIFGELQVLDPQTGLSKAIPALPDVAGCYSNKDNNSYEWFAAAGPKRGKINNASGLGYNLGSSARAGEADLAVVRGINPVIDDTTYGIVYWGVKTLQRADTLLQFENVADLVIFLLRAIQPLAKKELFEPNDIATWKTIWRNVNPLLKTVKARRGIWDYKYQGDQDAETIDDIVVNDKADIDAGKYTFIIWIKPKVAMTYVGIKMSITNSGVAFEDVIGEPLV